MPGDLPVVSVVVPEPLRPVVRLALLSARVVCQVPPTLEVTEKRIVVMPTAAAAAAALAVMAVAAEALLTAKPAAVAAVAAAPVLSPARARTNSRVRVRPPPIPVMVIMGTVPDRAELPVLTAILGV